MTATREVVLITGANTGIGFEIVKALCKSNKGYDIIVSGRSLEKVEQAISSATTEFPSSSSKLYPLQVDIEYDDSIKKAFEEVNSIFGRVDALVNNAGGSFDPELASGKLTEREMWNKSWNVNISGSQVMTSTFVPLLLKASKPRLLFITSGTSNLTDSENLKWGFNQSPPKGWPKEHGSMTTGIPAYRSSKTGLNMVMREWHRVLKNDGVLVWAISPGFLATGLGGVGADLLKKFGAGNPSIGGEFVKSVLEGERDADVGKIVNNGGVQTW